MSKELATTPGALAFAPGPLKSEIIFTVKGTLPPVPPFPAVTLPLEIARVQIGKVAVGENTLFTNQFGIAGFVAQGNTQYIYEIDGDSVVSNPKVFFTKAKGTVVSPPTGDFIEIQATLQGSSQPPKQGGGGGGPPPPDNTLLYAIIIAIAIFLLILIAFFLKRGGA